MLTQRDLIAIQRSAGNTATTGLLAARPTVQRCGGDSACACCTDEPGAVVQRAKIDFRELTWADFKGKPPSKFPAATYIGMHPIPKKLKQEARETDTGTPCTIGKKPGTEFEATRSLDGSALGDVKAYMWQEKSGAKADHKNGLKSRTAAAVKECKKSFDAQAKQIAKEAATECKGQVKPCQEAFRDGSTEFTLELGDQTITVTDAAECAKSFVTDCKKAHVAANPPAELAREVGVTKPTKSCPALPVSVAATITASERSECDGAFKDGVSEANAAESASLLAHEQLHFTISNKFATDLHDDLVGVAPNSVTEVACGQKAAAAKVKAGFAALKLGAQFKTKWNEEDKKRRDTQTAYDDETCHGLDDGAQGTWSGKF
jgi:hypothetical protein